MLLKKPFVVLLLLVMVFVSACGKSQDSQAQPSTQSGSAAAKRVFKLGHQNQTSHIWHKTAEKFNEELVKRSNGNMKVDIYPAAQLGGEKDMVQQMETGSIDFGIITNAYMSTRDETLNSWFMPFLFKDLQEAAKARKSAPVQQMLKGLEKQGVVGLDFIFAGNRHILMKSNAVKTVDDLKGKKIRIVGNPVFQEFWTSTGAGPTPLPLPEVYTAFQTGVIDGIDIDLDALNTEKYYEVGKELTLTNHMTFPAVVMASKVVFDKLTPEEQKIVKESVEAAAQWGVDESIKREMSNLAELKAKNVKVYELPNKDSFKPIQQKIYDKYSQKNAVIKSFIEANLK